MRKFLVVLDDSKECLNAMRFAAMRASNTGGGVAILSILGLLVSWAISRAERYFLRWRA